MLGGVDVDERQLGSEVGNILEVVFGFCGVVGALVETANDVSFDLVMTVHRR